MNWASWSLWGLLAAIAAGFLRVSWHFYARFTKRRHPLSILITLLPLGWVTSCALVMHPELRAWRGPVLAVSALQALLLVVAIQGAQRAMELLKAPAWKEPGE